MITRLLEYHKQTGASHYYSAQSVIPLLEMLLDIKRPEDEIILSKEHAKSAMTVLGLPTTDKFASVGTALPFVLGKAFLNPHIDYYVVTGDGEWQEGANWEAVMLMRRLGLQNISIWCDYNGKQAMGDCGLQAPEEVQVFLGDKGKDWTYHYRSPE